jgi:myosin-18
MQVRDWPWWRLLVRVTPLLNVHRTEEQLKIAHDELTAMKLKLEKLEGDRNSLKTENSKLEAKVSLSIIARAVKSLSHAVGRTISRPFTEDFFN